MFQILLLFLLAAPVCALTLLTENNPPFNVLSEDGMRVSGLSTAMLDEMARRSGEPVVHQLLPWARALTQAEITPDTCVYSTVRLPEREAKFQWLGPLAHNTWVLFARNDFKGKLRSLDDARPYRIAGANLGASMQWLSSLGFTHLEPSSTDELNAAKLAGKRADLWIGTYYSAQRFMEQNKVVGIRARWWVREVDYYLACSLSTAKSKVDLLRSSLKSMQDDGSYARISARYARLVPSLPKLIGPHP